MTTLHASWSLGYMICHEENVGQLKLRIAGKGASLNPGDKVTLEQVPSTWKITPSASDTGWSVSSDNDNTYLTRKVGSDPFKVGEGDSEASIQLIVTPPENATVGKAEIHVQLEDSLGNPLSGRWGIVFNLIKPEQPVVAFANDPSAAILTAKGAIDFSNTLVCTLLNTQPDAVTSAAGATIKLSFLAPAANEKPIDISQQVKSDNVTVLVDWPSGTEVAFNNDNDGTWLATLPASSWQTGSSGKMTVTITGLAFEDPQISLMEAQFELTGFGQPYTTSAWFNAVGPFTISVELNRNDSNTKKYRVDTSGKEFSITSIENQPPLIWHLEDLAENPSGPGYFSFDKSSPRNV